MQNHRIDRKDIVACTCFFLSGCAALIYEVCWIRKASLVFGSTTYALSTILAVFFLGLALGSYIFGRVSQRTDRPLMLFALMELAIGVLALGSLLAFDLVDTLYGYVYRASGEQTSLLMTVRFVLVSLILLPPSILMGGTLPLFCRQYVNSESRIARSVGFLYGLNTLGAAVGCAVTGLVLLPRVGTFGAITIGVILDIVVAVAAGLLGLRAVLSRGVTKRHSLPGDTRVSTYVSSLLFLAGFVALGNEVLWTRHLALLIRNSVYTYTLTLTAVLIGIVLGSIVAAFLFDRSRSRAFWFGLLQVATGLLSLALMLIPAEFWARFDPLPLTTYFLLLLPPAVISGAIFPLGVRMVLDDPHFAGISVGRLSALNTLGGIAGSLVTGFAVLPFLGQQWTLLFTTGLSLAGGYAVLFLLDRSTSQTIRWSTVTASLAIWFVLPLGTGTRLPADFLSDAGAGDRLLAFKEGLSSNLAVIQRHGGGLKVLEINRLWQGQDRKSHQIMAAHVPMLLRSDPRSVLVVGVGAGQTASRFLMYSIDRLDCVDIEPAVFDVIHDHFDSRWMNDRRVRLLREDGRSYLAHSGESYDVISIEVGQIIRPGVPFFYTEEFYVHALERLTPGGFLSQFVPIPYFSFEEFRSVVSTFLNSFPQSFLWYNREELLLIGVKTPRLRLRGERLVLLEEDPSGDNEVRHDLRMSLLGEPQYGMQQLTVFLGSFIAGPEGLSRLSAGAPVLSDDRPVLDYTTYKVKKRDTNEIPIVAELRRNLTPVEEIIALSLNNEERAKIERVRQRNLGNLEARALLRRAGELRNEAEHEERISLLTRAAEYDPESVVVNLTLAKALLEQNRLKEAESYYLAVLRLRGDERTARQGLAEIRRRMGVTSEHPH